MAVRSTLNDDEDRAMAFRPFPIDNQRTKSELRKRLQALIDDTAEPILNGAAQTFEDYRYRVGQLRGYLTALAELDSIESQEET